MMTALSFSLAYAGFTALAMAMHRHHRQVWRRDPTPLARAGYRILGTLCLTLALAACVVDSGWFVGLIAWLAILSAMALVFDVLLPYAPRAAALASLLALPIAAATALSWL